MRFRPRQMQSRGALGNPYTQDYTDTELSSAFFGYFDTTTTAGRRMWQTADASFFVRVRGSACTLACSSGDSSPWSISVDGGAETIPVFSSTSITLFTGLSDDWHLVYVRPDNSVVGSTYTPTTGTLLSVTGAAPQAQVVGTKYHIKDPAFAGVATFAETATYGGNYLPTYPRPTANAGWGVSNGSVAFKAKFTDIYVFTTAPEVWYSVDGGAWTKQTLGASVTTPAGKARNWRKISDITGSLSTYKELIICDSPVLTTDLPLMGILLTGTGAELATPSVARTVVHAFGASQTYGFAATMGSVDVQRVQVGISGFATGQHGNSGGTIAQANAAFAAWVTKIPVSLRQHVQLSIGINSADDGSFQADYQTLINNFLSAGFTKLVCRGLVQITSNVSKNAKILAAVTATANPAVVYADVSTWAVSTTGTANTIHMPDGTHPNDAGYVTMAAWSIRDHSALLP